MASARLRPIVIEYFYDIGSPYSYIGLETLERYVSGPTPLWPNVQVKYVPFLLGGVFKLSENKAPATVPARVPYLVQDLKRLSHTMQLALLVMPDAFPANSIKAMRVLTSFSLSCDNATLLRATRALFEFYWKENANPADDKMIRDALVRLGGFSASEVDTHMRNAEGGAVKEQLKKMTELAVERGSFGAPTMFIPTQCFNPHMLPASDRGLEASSDSLEMFFGSDRINMIATLLELPWLGHNPTNTHTHTPAKL